MDTEQIKKFLDSGAGIDMKKYLQSELDSLKNIDNINEKDTTTQQSLELKAQKRAYKKLKEILEFIMTVSVENRPRDPRDRYDVGLD